MRALAGISVDGDSGGLSMRSSVLASSDSTRDASWLTSTWRLINRLALRHAAYESRLRFCVCLTARPSRGVLP